MPKSKKTDQLEQQIAELTLDLQRQRADFENYRKQVDREKTMAREAGQASMVMKLVPVIDNIERAVTHIPPELADNTWAQGIASLTKQLESTLKSLDVARIEASPGTAFNPEMHEAVQFEEDAEGEHEVIAEELQAGYTLNGSPIRHSMVKVTRK